MKKVGLLLLIGWMLAGAVWARETVPLADPFILLHDGIYYAYGTHANDGIEVYTSVDLKNWEFAGLALKKGDVWGEKWFWAPEVYRANGRFLMYYSAERHICAAWADSPLGPFTQKEKRPMMPEEPAIDHTLFIDDDGTPRIYMDRFKDGTSWIWTAELEKDLVTIKRETFRRCFGPDQPWELKHQRIVEGSAVLKHQGKYYLTYSGNGYPSPHYGIGYAVADRPDGPWEKYSGNPVLQLPGDLKGVGHHAFFKDKDGALRVVFHAHFNADKVHPRQMYITRAGFSGDGLSVSPDYWIPELRQNTRK